MFACVPQEPVPLVYDGDIIPISDPIQLHYSPCQFKSTIEIIENKTSIIKIWLTTHIETMDELLLWEIDLNKIITDDKTYSPPSPPIIRKKILTDIYGNKKKQSISMPTFRSYAKSNKSISQESLNSLIKSFTEESKRAMVNNWKLTETAIRTGDYILKEPFYDVGFKLQGYGFYKNKKVLIATIDDSTKLYKFNISKPKLKEAYKKMVEESGEEHANKVEKIFFSFLEETEKAIVPIKGYAIIDPATNMILTASIKIHLGVNEIKSVIKQTLF